MASSPPDSFPFDDSAEPEALPCAGKLVFDTEGQAAVAANVAEFQRGVSLRPYACRYCDLWHLSSA